MSYGASISTSKAAYAALVLGILAFLCFGPLTAIPGVICGIVALVSIARSEGSIRGFGVGIAGLITSGIGLIVGICEWLFILPMIAVLVPALGHAREVSNRAYDAASLRLIATACYSYASSNGNHMPPDLFATTPYLSSPKYFKSKSSSTPELKSMPTTPSALDGHCDWVYVGADLTSTTSSPSLVILLYSKDVYSDHGRNIAFLDGHAEWVKASDLAGVFDTSNTVRSGSGLRPVYIDTMPSSTLVPGRGMTPPPRRTRPAPPPGFAPAPPGGFNPPIPAAPGYSVAEARDDLRSGDATRQRKAVSFFQNMKPADTAADVRRDVAVALESMLEKNKDVRTSALRGLRYWAIKDNVPALLKVAEEGNPKDPAQCGDISAALEGIGTAGDTSAAASIAKHLNFFFTRNSASIALIALGPDAESAVWPYLMHTDFPAAQTACNVLAQIGTAKSLPQLEEALTTKTPFVKEKAQAAIDAINARSNR